MKVNLTNQKLKTHFDFETEDRGLVGIFGHSGAGKTQLLNAISGFDANSNKGFITNNSYSKIVYMFQKPILFNHWTVQQNFDFVISKTKHLRFTCSELIKTFNCQFLLAQYPEELSGGEFQRACFIFTLLQVTEATMILLDEPFTALDKSNRKKAVEFLYKLKKDHLIYYVSHSVEELYEYSDEIIHVKNRKVIEYGKTAEIMRNSQSSLPLANLIIINNIPRIIYSERSIISLDPIENTSFNFNIKCTITSMETFDNSIRIGCLTQDNQDISIELSPDVVKQLGLTLNLIIYLNDKV